MYLRHARLGSLDFDTGIHDQAIWLLARGRGFDTVRGLPVFGHHATVGYYLLAPLSWLGAGPQVWNLLQVLVLALGAVPVFLLARLRTGHAWIGTALGAAFLLHPSTGFFAWELFHPEVLALTPLLTAYYCSVRRRWTWFAFWVVLAVVWKEDVALVVVVLGLLVAVRGDRRVGLWTAAGALAWFLAWTLGIFPLLDGGHVQSAGLYADVGGSPGGIVRTLFSSPRKITSRLVDHEAGHYLWRLTAPYAFVPLLAVPVLLLGVPQVLFNLITNVPWTKTATYHYAALPVFALTVALVEGVAWLGRRVRGPRLPRALAAGVLAAAAVTTAAWGLSPIGHEYRRGWWPLVADPRADVARADLARIPGSAGVSASYNLVPQLSRRAEIYSFPNPWESSNFGIDGRPRRSPRRVQWILLDRRVLDAHASGLLDRIVARGRFRVVSDRADYVLARRVGRDG